MAGFDGVAPGAQLIGLKISNNARGGVSTTGSMQRAMAYAARFAESRGLRLVLNLSFGLGNEFEGRAVIDSIINAFLMAHPSVVFAISAGNDGPGMSTLGFPASADLALSVGAAFPGAFARSPYAVGPPVRDVLGWWSSRGGEIAKPDLITPGVAFSAVPRFDTGDEVKGGTSMAAPHAAGLASCLISAMVQEGRNVSAAEVTQALRVSGRRFQGASILDQGAGEPRWRGVPWLVGATQAPLIVRTSKALRPPSGATGSPAVRHHRSIPCTHVAACAPTGRSSSARWLSAPASSGRTLETTIVAASRGKLLRAMLTRDSDGWNPNDTLAGPPHAVIRGVPSIDDPAFR